MAQINLETIMKEKFSDEEKAQRDILIGDQKEVCEKLFKDCAFYDVWIQELEECKKLNTLEEYNERLQSLSFERCKKRAFGEDSAEISERIIQIDAVYRKLLDLKSAY
ncbi:hypothetical protein GOV06_03300 [Candidatus Woesearchaeota archaeon]|nr:hypothetical protein [Candidatus Woesearchaeota archaeon]